jgi:hypothetical protein
MKIRRSLWLPIAGLVLAAACSITRVSDTGYVGTWSRGSGTGTSVISIAKTGDQYRFTWKLTSADRKWTVTCDKNSHCTEIIDGVKTAEFQFSTRVDPATGHLIVESDQSIFDPKGEVKEKRLDVDELILESGNLKLGSYTFERNGKTLTGDDRPKRFFEKISNSVMEPGA